MIGDEDKKRVIRLIREYREEAHFFGLFLEPYSRLQDSSGLLHPSYNQCVRTGRMSCSKPNAQQLNKRAKALIVPNEGEGILDIDYSQIEFRLIAHYINDLEAIRAYREDPTTDFHKWVASICGVERTPAKIMNFMMGYGGGKAKTVSSLSGNPDIVAEVTKEVDALIASGRIRDSDRAKAFNRLCQERGEYVYTTYHQRLPGIKITTRKAAQLIERRGYVFNAFGRRRYLPRKASYRAFNSVVQSCAADLLKERIVAIAPRYNAKTREYGLRIFALVHDNVAFIGPSASVSSPEVHSFCRSILNHPSVEFRVPIEVEGGWSLRNWTDAGEATKLTEPEAERGPLIK